MALVDAEAMIAHSKHLVPDGTEEIKKEENIYEFCHHWGKKMNWSKDKNEFSINAMVLLMRKNKDQMKL